MLREIVYYFIELSKFDKPIGTLVSMLDKWIYFIKSAGIMEEIPSGFNDAPIRHAFEKALVANMSRAELAYYDKAGMAIADARGAIELALEEGEKKGLHEGSVSILKRQLQHRFGSLPSWAEEKIIQADPSSLATWSLQIFDAQSLDEVFS